MNFIRNEWKENSLNKLDQIVPNFSARAYQLDETRDFSV